MKDGLAAVFAALSDGRVHSGAALAGRRGVSRSAIWRTVQRLRGLGLDIRARQGQGYQLDQAIELLSAATISRALSSGAAKYCRAPEIQFAVSSTNTVLLQRLAAGAARGQVLLAEYQAAGRGRRGRVWLSPPGAGLCLSLGWRFRQKPAALGRLSLYAGLAVAEALAALDVRGIALKWPNDILLDGKKLGGILIETRAGAGGAVDCVIGAGVNYRLPAKTRTGIGQAVADIYHHAGPELSRNRIAAAVLNHLFALLDLIERGRDGGLLERWRRYDGYQGRRVALRAGRAGLEGIVAGVNDEGALLLRTDAGVRAFAAGEVSLKETLI